MPVAGRSGPHLWTGQEDVPPAQGRAGHPGDAVRDTRAGVRTALQALGFSGRLNTAFVERVNLTVRRSVAGLARRTWATAQEVPQLLAHLEWWRGYYHFVRPHAALRVALAQPMVRGGRRQPQRYRQRTPAMAAGLTNHRWTVRELLALPLLPASVGAA